MCTLPSHVQDAAQLRIAQMRAASQQQACFPVPSMQQGLQEPAQPAACPFFVQGTKKGQQKLLQFLQRRAPGTPSTPQQLLQPQQPASQSTGASSGGPTPFPAAAPTPSPTQQHPQAAPQQGGAESSQQQPPAAPQGAGQGVSQPQQQQQPPDVSQGVPQAQQQQQPPDTQGASQGASQAQGAGPQPQQPEALHACEGLKLNSAALQPFPLKYPFGLHSDPSVSLGFTARTDGALQATDCLRTCPSSADACGRCLSLQHDSKVQGIMRKAHEGIAASCTTKYAYRSMSQMQEVARHHKAKADRGRLDGFNLGRRIVSLTRSLQQHKRFMLALSDSRAAHVRVQQLIRVGLSQGRSLAHMEQQLALAIAGAYKPKVRRLQCTAPVSARLALHTVPIPTLLIYLALNPSAGLLGC